MQNKLQELTDKLYNEGLYCSFSNSLIHSFNLSCSFFLSFCCRVYDFTFVFAECKTFLNAASITTHEDKAKKSGWDEFVGSGGMFLILVNGVDRISEDKTSAAVLRKFVNTVYDILRDVKIPSGCRGFLL